MQIGRNDPCPCGSGLKYKKCCGESHHAIAPAATRPRAVHRECGGCTACCDGWLKITVYGNDVYPGKPCPYSTGHCCRIYEHRPLDPCKNFVCGWLDSQSPFPDDFRPDKLGVIILRARWRGLAVYALVPAGRDPDDKLIEWMTDFSNSRGIPFLYEMRGEWYAYGPPAFRQDVAARHARGEKLWDEVLSLA